MKKRIILMMAVFVMVVQILAGCGSKDAASESKEITKMTESDDHDALSELETNDSTSADHETGADETAENQPVETETEESKNSQVASADEMAAPVQIDSEGLTAIDGSMVKDGVYAIDVESSSSMFNITDCQLTVKDGKMTAVMTMGGKGYLYVYMGTGEAAAIASEADYIPYVENDSGEHTFEVPVSALNTELDCAAFSKNKQKWYDRVLLFRADDLPLEAFADGVVTSLEDLNLKDGLYTVDVKLEGGSGKASVQSPASLKIEDGKAYVTIIWSSSKYDYMKVGKEQYHPINTEGNSTFEIPVSAFDWKVAVTADTTAMGEPHEISYTLYFDAASIKAAE